MKLRIKGNSLRLRIAPSEMTHLMDAGRIEDAVQFGQDEDARLTYALEHSGEAKQIGVRYEPASVTIILPSQGTRAWAQGNEVGLYGSVQVRNGRLEVAIEKDWACLDKSEAQNQDTFPNPNQGAAC